MSTFDDLVAESAAVDVSTWVPGSSPGGTTQVEAAGLTVLDGGEATVRVLAVRG